MHQSTQYLGSSLGFDIEDFAVNETAAGLAEGLAAAHRAYGVERYCICSNITVVGFIPLPGHGCCSWSSQMNVTCLISDGSSTSCGNGDENYSPLCCVSNLERLFTVRHGIHVVRQTFAGLVDSIRLEPSTRRLFLSLFSDKHTVQAVEISTVYFRAGYSPSDFTHPRSWDVRRLLERSRAIKCPSIPLQLAGAKKVQQVLTQPGMLERFLCSAERWGSEYVITKDEIDELRDSWMDMWALNDDIVTVDDDDTSKQVLLNGFSTKRGKGTEGTGVRKARACASSLVLKPQREGGGNNVYTSSIPAFLDGLTVAERPAWIAMALIVPPERQMCYFVRPAVDHGDGRLGKIEVANELGIFGWTLFGEGRVREEKEVGWLMRTKRKDSEEGGISVGCSVLDSLILVDG